MLMMSSFKKVSSVEESIMIVQVKIVIAYINFS